MRRYIAFVLLAAMLFATLSGCGWMDGEYVFEEPSSLSNAKSSKNVIAVSSYSQMCGALLNLVESGAVNAIFDVSNFNDGSVRFFMDAAIRYVTTSNAMGAYAVDGITYEIGTSTGDQAVAINIQYRFGRDHIMKIIRSYGMDEVRQTLVDALQSFEPSIVLRVSKYEDIDFEQWIADYALMHPETVIEVPKIEMNIYPQKGTDRIIALDFAYTYSPVDLMDMQRSVNSILNNALQDTEQIIDPLDQYIALYDYLTDNGIYTLEEMSDTPVYSVLVNNTGDCASFSNVYAMLCRRAGLECEIVSGTYNDRPWVWNIIYVDDVFLHFDLLRCYQTKGFALHGTSEMDGYIWDYGSFPKK